MLTRFVRIQLAIFIAVGLTGMAAMFFEYMQVPTLLGIGKLNVKLELPETGGLYRFSNVTYRGVQIGKVTAVGPTADGAEATLAIDTSPKIPADVHAAVRSISAVGEQYIDLVPRSESGPYLRDGSVIQARDTSIPPPVGPMLDKLSALTDSIPKDKLSQLLDESFRGFNGSGYDLQTLLDSSTRISHDANDTAGHTRALADDAVPFLDAQTQTSDATRRWAHNLAGVTDQLVTDDPQFRKLLRTGPDFSQEVSRLLTQLKPTLPVLLANLTTIGQIGVTYHPSLEQLLVLLPPTVAAYSSYGVTNNPTGLAVGGFTLTIADPPACTVGFLPPSQWRSPADTTTIDTPDNLYCKLPQDAPIAVRGVRNNPCMGHPGKRAPTVEICNSDKPYEPLAMRQHVLGPSPLDPNLLAQGVPPDDRVTVPPHIFGPLDGTPLPPGATPAGTPPGPPPPGSVNQPPTAPSAFVPNGSGPSVATARYDPATGRYVTPDGLMFRQADLARSSKPKTWKDMVLTAAGPAGPR
ncbi:MCE family protein [Mycobacterium conspicuum]|jgi:virulence factor Mce-like protein|uniref:Virulence factor Mce n=1 Tax=Mycobacterium conspicuum TaxID=44010 RepID=A0A1X1TQ49_9MYCO|nr:MlaD family protein [Mycobacterium conspicuum]ORV46697.1 virulence factor Mce [Mycobacterium conspicuum]BBZ40251.1 virulence factor Mce [Mycobacterium conspicuum]